MVNILVVSLRRLCREQLEHKAEEVTRADSTAALSIY